ncbi:X2-like carbohydrate binding domain-containing protein [Paenibacillus germinis]|uniref:X2-like carbohydrate binding domain-containing protein n=1 Tax=Paenibacillus germinis TaxID=2654979 RepID=UPI0028A9A8BB|nr:X2-like carbohydrate binding domain-containing protein [Paenibacillus germinis]
MGYTIKKTRLWLLVFIFFITLFAVFIPKGQPVQAADNGLAQKPYMGWSSYSMQVYHSGNWITAAQIMAQSDAMHAILQPHGYNYINVDAAWNGSMDEYGRPQPSTTLYPNGLNEVINHVHNNGQKFGLYFIPGMSPATYDANLPIYGTSCHAQDIVVLPLTTSDYWNIGYKIDFSKPCAQSYINSIADEIASWGVDFVKFDSVTPGSGHNDTSIDARGDVKAWSQALAPHNIWFELSWALDINYADTWKKYANGWRVDWDIECYCGTAGLTNWANIARLFPRAGEWWRHAGPGGWNNFDSLNIGNGAMDGITPDERQTAMTFWAISSAQLYTGNDLTNLDEFGIKLLTNDEAIAVNQDGKPAHPVSLASEQQVWYANNGDGTYTVGLFNLGSSNATVNVNWSDIGLSGAASVRDLWSHSELGVFNSSFSSGDLAPHASRLLKVTSQGGVSSINDDDTGISYTGDWQRNSNRGLGATQNLAITVIDSLAQNSIISPSTGSFDKNLTAQNDVTTTMTLNGNTLSGISNEGVDLVVGTDYTVSGNSVTIKKDYLAAQPVGTTQLTFTFSAGARPILSIAVSDTSPKNSTILPSTRNFDKTLQADVTTTMLLAGNQLSTITSGGTPLVLGTDYTVSGNTLTIKKEYLALQPLGTTNLLISFSAGNPQTLAIVVSNTSQGGSIAINNDDSGITYSAAWQRSTNRGLGDYLNDVHFTERNNEYFEYAFTGTGIEVITEMDSSQGDIDVYVDGVFKQTISTYYSSRLAQQPVYGISGLPSGPHTIKVVKKSGSYMLIDKLRVLIADLINPAAGSTVTGSVYRQVSAQLVQVVPSMTSIQLTPSAASELTVQTAPASHGATASINDTNAAIHYSGSWGYSNNRGLGDYQNDVHYTENNNDYFEYVFKGTGIELITEKDTSQGDIDIYVDDVFKETVSTYHASRLAQQTVYSIAGLPSGSHTLKVVKKSGSYMLLDKITILVGDLMSPDTGSFDKKIAAQEDVSTTLSLGEYVLDRIDNGRTTLVPGTDYTLVGNTLTIKKAYLVAQPVGTTNLTFVFSGDYQNDVHFTETNNDSFKYTFKGTGIAVITEKDASQGEIDVYVDDVFKQTVNTYNATRLVQQTVYSISGLSNSLHTIKVVKKSGSYMLLDKLSFTVAKAPSTAAVTTTGVTKVKNTSATIAGKVTADGGTAVTSRGIVYSTAPTPTLTSDGSTKVSLGSGLGEFSEKIKKLKPNTTYYARAYATNSVGTSYGVEVTFKTSKKSENQNDHEDDDQE